jgi:Mn-containing catalase
MWVYEKKLQFPVKIKNPDPRAASIIISQLGGPGGNYAFLFSSSEISEKRTCQG